jgi:hypothetical protein
VPRISLAALTLLGAAAIPVAASSTPPSGASSPEAGAAASCHVLPATKKLRKTLRRLHVRSLQRSLNRSFKVTGPRGRVYNGRCGSTHYAVTTFSHTIGGTYFGTQDQPVRGA